MGSKIDEALKKIAADTAKENSSKTATSSAGRFQPASGLPGDPACPLCGGVGFLRQDLPVGHPDFGKLQVCACRSGQVSLEKRRRLFALSNLNELSHLTFDIFRPRGRIGLPAQQANSLETAYNHSYQFAQSLRGWLVLYGDYGCGKTHLAAAIANYAVSMDIPTLFLTVPDLLDALRFAFDDPEAAFEERFNEIRTARLLVLDDFGTQNATPWAQEKLFQIINYRYINRLPTVVTTNLSTKQIEPRIRSRLEDPDLVTTVRMAAPDYRNPAGDMGYPELSTLSFLHNLTFENFDLRKGEKLPGEDLESLDKAYQAARQYAENPAGWLVFMGPYGSGKTHLAAAIANRRSALGAPPLFIGVIELLDHLRATFNPDSFVRFDHLFDKVRTTPLLILDDLSTQSMTPWVREKLYQLFNYRYIAELCTVITTSDREDQMDARIESRLLDRRLCQIIALTAPPYRGMLRKESKPRTRKTKMP